MSRARLRGARSTALLALVATATVFVGASPAYAAKTSQTLNNTCEAFLVGDGGATGGVIPPDKLFPLSSTVPNVSGPTEVNAHTSFNGVGASISVPVPDSVDTKVPEVGDNGVVPVEAAANLQLTIEIDGAAGIGTPSQSGGQVVGATATKQGSNQVLLIMPGKDAGSTIPGDDRWFIGGSTFMSPKLTIPITAGNAGTKITAHLVKFQSDALADVFAGPGINTRAFCTPDKNTLGTVQVVTPPPPGAPNAVADVAQTDQGKSVDVDVLANDTANKSLAIDKDSLAITGGPAHGSAKINTDHTVTYTPASGFSGTDTFSYKLCSVPAPATTTTSTSTTTTEPDAVIKSVAKPQATTAHCDHADVTVTVLAPQQVATAPQGATTPTTVAAAAELPHTGSSDMPLMLLGGALVIGGLATAGFARSRRKYSLD
jgi:LPXTG-motif cell wall-anchored protein